MNHLKKLLLALSLFLSIGTVLLAQSREVVDPEITQEEIMEHIKFLACDELEGRAAGSAGAVVASEYVAEYFKKIGLEPLGDDGTYYQNFSLPRGFEALPTTSVKTEKGKKSRSFKFGKEITVMPGSAPGRAKGIALFAGFGISAPMYGYDDYEGFDVEGKIVIVLRGLPDDSKGLFKSREAVRNHGTFTAKQETAAGLGAAALILVNDPARFDSKKKDVLVKSGKDPQGAIPFIHMTRRGGVDLLSGTGISLGKTQSRIDKKLKPATKVIDDLVIEVHAGIEPIELKVRNVVGILKAGAENKKNENIVVGGHFDHVGLGEFGSRGGSKAKGRVHNGADDNASGTAAVIEIAAYLASVKNELERNIIFAAFTAEEMGLHGSKHYVEHPPIPLANTAAMINLDMVGRLKRGDLFIGGVGTSPIFDKLLKEANRTTRLKLKFGKGGRAPTDSTSFYSKELPVLFFFTGLHADYHLPSDDVKLIDKRGCEKVVRLAAEVAYVLAGLDEKPPFSRADAGGFRSGPHLGLTVVQKGDGVYVSAVEKKSPASKARFRENDKVLEFEGMVIRTSADFYGAKAGCPAGKKVTITIRRSGRVKKLKVKLGK